MYYEIVAVCTFSYVADESVDETFKASFVGASRSKRLISLPTEKINVFLVQASKINQKSIQKFESFLKENGFVKLYSANYLHPGNIDARFFTINLNMAHFKDIKELLVSKIEVALNKKLGVHKGQFDKEIYYFHLSKSQVKSKKLVKLLDDLLDNPAINLIYLL